MIKMYGCYHCGFKMRAKRKPKRCPVCEKVSEDVPKVGPAPFVAMDDRPIKKFRVKDDPHIGPKVLLVFSLLFLAGVLIYGMCGAG